VQQPNPKLQILNFLTDQLIRHFFFKIFINKYTKQTCKALIGQKDRRNLDLFESKLVVGSDEEDLQA
jgi:hypothetical protein